MVICEHVNVTYLKTVDKRMCSLHKRKTKDGLNIGFSVKTIHPSLGHCVLV